MFRFHILEVICSAWITQMIVWTHRKTRRPIAVYIGVAADEYVVASRTELWPSRPWTRTWRPGPNGNKLYKADKASRYSTHIVSLLEHLVDAFLLVLRPPSVVLLCNHRVAVRRDGRAGKEYTSAYDWIVLVIHQIIYSTGNFSHLFRHIPI